MNASRIQSSSETDWDRIDALTDDMIDISDTPPLTAEQLKHARLRLPRKLEPVTLKIDAEVLAWFKAQGADFEQRLNAALRIYVEAHKTYTH